MAYKITNKIPVPKKQASGGRSLKYPWDKMKVGDSFSKKTKKGLSAYRLQNILKICSNSYVKHNNKKAEFTTKISSSGSSVRIWRTK